MINMKRTLLSLGILATIGVLIFLPAMIYGGFAVQTVEGSLTFESSATSPTLCQSMIKQSIGPSVVNSEFVLRNASENAWAYAFGRIGGSDVVEVEQSEDNPPVDTPVDDISIDLSIIFNLTKDGETVKLIEFDLTRGEGLHQVDVVFGPNDGLTTSGTYMLYITISLRLSTPGGDQSLDVPLGPFEINVEIQ